ncbi:MAG: hypothetical protein HKN06_02660 [Gammaproteobacteria bacterium]|nr:hypothetical protein [Gammaproteobacteria bacterium]
MIRLMAVCLSLLMLAGCVGVRCDKVRPYQQTTARAPIQVPDDLSEPRMRARAPEVDANAPVRRADGRCLEEPPEYTPIEEEPATS